MALRLIQGGASAPSHPYRYIGSIEDVAHGIADPAWRAEIRERGPDMLKLGGWVADWWGEWLDALAAYDRPKLRLIQGGRA